MRRFEVSMLVVPAVIAGIVLATSAASPTAAAQAQAQAPYGDSVAATAGVGVGTVGSWGFTIDARSGPSGEAPTGSITVNSLYFGPYSFSVSCLTVSGNRAAMIGVRSVPPAPLQPTWVLVTVEDNGGPGQGRLGFDWDFVPPYPPVPPPVPAPTACPIRIESLGPIRDGDITVVDVPALPTTRQQCLDGGWRTFGAAFRNQGQCVAAVRHEARSA